MEHSKRSTKTETARRVGIIIKLIISGITTRRELLQYVTNADNNTDNRSKWQPWKVCDEQIDKYIGKANKEILRLFDRDNIKELILAKIRLDDLYKRSLNISDYKTCLSIQKERNNLLGLNQQIQKIEISDDTDYDMGKLSTNELRILAGKC